MDSGRTRFKQKQYMRLVQQNNPLLFFHFESLYSKLLARLENFLGAKVRLQRKIGMPGFHIFIKENANFGPPGNRHFDLQHMGIPTEIRRDFKLKEVYSLTLPLRLPRAGGALKIWDFHFLDSVPYWNKSLNELTDEKSAKIYPYRLGHLSFQTGLYAHQLVLAPKIRADDERITLQGHLVKDKRGWIIYW